VALAGIYAALRISRQKLADQRFLLLGAGSAATGIAELISQEIVMEGLTLQEARSRNNLFDINGLLTSSRKLMDFQEPFVIEHAPIGSFAEAVKALRPTGIIGVSTVPKLFNQKVIEAISKINERPMIFPYSNPTSRLECTAEEAYTWSKGRAIFASGSPFAPLTVGGKHFVPGQGNNVYIFPAMGMAVYATEAKRVTDEMFIVATNAVAEQVGQDSLDVGLIYPPQSKILTASLHVAARIAEYVFDHGLARIARPEDVSHLIGDKAYVPAYRRID
jgi:malate dehydrogenase (oxaloacetate-decarboxylating)(NADP+)